MTPQRALLRQMVLHTQRRCLEKWCYVVPFVYAINTIHWLVLWLKVKQEPRSSMLQLCRLSLLILDGVASISFEWSY